MTEFNEGVPQQSASQEPLIEASVPEVSQDARHQIEQWIAGGEQLTLTPVIIDVLMKVYKGLVKQAANNSFSAAQYRTGVKRQEPGTVDNSLLAIERTTGLQVNRLLADGSIITTILADDGRTWRESIPSIYGNNVIGVIIENNLPDAKG